MSGTERILAVIRLVHEDRCPVCAGEREMGCDEQIMKDAREIYRAVVEEYEESLT